MNINLFNFNIDNNGIQFCEVANGEPVICHPRTDQVLYQTIVDNAEFRVHRTTDEQFYTYQKGTYEAVPNKPTFVSGGTNEMIQLIEISEVTIILEEVGVITTDASNPQSV